MARFERKTGPWPAFQKAIKSKAAVSNNALDLGVAMVMADAHEQNTPVKVQLKFKGLDDNRSYGVATTEAHVSQLDSNEMRLGVAFDQPIQIPQDALVTLKMESPNFKVTQRPTLLFETAANAEPDSTGVVFAEGVSHTLTSPLYNTAKYDEHHATGLPIADAHFNVVCAGKRGFHVQDAQISSTMNIPEHPTPIRNGLTESVGNEAGYEGYYNARSMTPADSIGGHMAFAKDKERHNKVQKTMLEALQIMFPDVPVEHFDVITSTSTKSGTPVSTEISASSAVDKHVLLGHSGWTIVSLTLLSMVEKAAQEGKLKMSMDIDESRTTLDILGGPESPIAAALFSLYKRFAEAENLPNAGRMGISGLPSITRLLTHTSGLPASVMAKSEDQENTEKALLDALTVRIDELSERVGGDEKEGEEKEGDMLEELEKEFAEMLLSRVSFVNVPGTVALPFGSEIESAIVGILILRLQKLLGQKVTVPEDSVERFMQEKMNGELACWNPFLANDKKDQLVEGDAGVMELLATGAVMELRDVIRIPCYMLRKTNEQRFEVEKTFSPEIPLTGTSRISVVKGWTKIDSVIYGRPCPIYVSQGGDMTVSAVMLYFVPKFDLCGVVNVTHPSFASNPKNLAKFYSILEPVIHCSVIGGLENVLKGEKKLELEASWKDERRPARPAQFHLVKTTKHVLKAPGKKEEPTHSFEGKSKTYYNHTVNPKTGKTNQITVVRNASGFYQVFSGSGIDEDPYVHLVHDARTGNTFVADPEDGTLTDHAHFSKNGLVIGNEYFSANNRLGHHDEIQKAINDLGKYHSKRPVEEVVLGAAIGNKEGTPSALLGATVATFNKDVDYSRVHIDEDEGVDDASVAASSEGLIGPLMRGGGGARAGRRSATYSRSVAPRGSLPRAVAPRTRRSAPRAYRRPYLLRGGFRRPGRNYGGRRYWPGILPLAVLGTLGYIALGGAYPGYYYRRGYGCYDRDVYGNLVPAPCPPGWRGPYDPYYG